jgi:diguanylate cyclase (GGDEF)-like protein
MSPFARRPPEPAPPRTRLPFAPAVLAIVLPVVLAVGASHYLLTHTVEGFQGVLNHAAEWFVPVSALRANLQSAVMPVHDYLIDIDAAPAEAEHLERVTARVEAALADTEALVARGMLDPGPVAAVRREWDAARDQARAVLRGADPPSEAATRTALRAFDDHLHRALEHVDLVFEDLLTRLSREWHAAGIDRAPHRALMGGSALVAVAMALGAAWLVLRMADRLKLSEARFADLARHDPLTGLDNRQELHRRLGEELDRARRFSRPFSLLILDVDHFRAVNDRHGHPAGDAALVAVARMAAGQVRDIDHVARYGGEAFAAILPETDVAGAAVLAERIRRHVAAHPVTVADGVDLPLTVSVGVAAFPSHGADAGALFKAADRALDQAKRKGRDRVEAARARNRIPA